MSEPKYVRPQFGSRSLAPMALLLLATIALGVDYYRKEVGSDTLHPVMVGFLIVGFAYGWTAGGCWMMSGIPNRYIRWAAQAGLAALLAAVLQPIGGSPYIHYLANLGGLILVQTLMFHVMKVPTWRRHGSQAEPPVSRHRQFGIGEILAATTCIALLMAVAMRYRRESVDQINYWLMLIAFWCLAPLISATAIFAVLVRHSFAQAFWRLLLAAALTVLAVAGLTSAQLWLTEIPPQPLYDLSYLVRLFAGCYAAIVVGYLCIPVAAALLGRWQSASEPVAEG